MTSSLDFAPGSGSSFDPLADLIVGSGERPPGWAPINLRTVGPLLRALLVTDGTVTKFLEAVMVEPIHVVVLRQEEICLESDNVELRAEAGERAIRRDVELLGERSGRNYVEASSVLMPDRLPAELVRRLDSHPQGLGRLLLEASLETRREVLWYGRERPGGPSKAAGRIRRTYRVISGGQPLMMITESFPRDLELT